MANCNRRWRRLRDAARALGLLALLLLAPIATARAAEPSFAEFVDSLWPEAEAAGVSRALFDNTLRGLQPDLSLPDLLLPGRDKTGSQGQAEFTRAPSEYLDRAYMGRLAETGRALAVKHADALRRIEAETGVDRYALLAIWGRETAYGAYKLPHDGIRVIATQAWIGRRKDVFRKEIIAALRMLQAGVPRADMRASWAGAIGMTQFLPSEYFQYAADGDGDGKIDLVRSVPDALASAARQLRGKGWVAGQHWGYEVRIPKGADCAFEGPAQARPLSKWQELGFARADGRPWASTDLPAEAYLMSPAGSYGPAFLVFENYRVIRRYNTSDLYAVFVGHLGDRIAGNSDFKTAWGGTAGQKTRTIEEIQRLLKERGADVEKIDGKIGSNTRAIIGAYQRAQRLKIDCWPSDELLAHLRQAAR